MKKYIYLFVFVMTATIGVAVQTYVWWKDQADGWKELFYKQQQELNECFTALEKYQ